jgi:hypothetical protein
MDADGPLMEEPSSRQWILLVVDLAKDPFLFPLRPWRLCGEILGSPAATRALYQRILASISGLNPGPLMDADGLLMEEPSSR